jgi:hypothetical protein
MELVLFLVYLLCPCPGRDSLSLLLQSKESSFPPRMLASRRQTVPSEWSNRGSVVSGVSSLLAPRQGTGVAPRYEVDQQSFIRLGTSCPTTESLSGELKHAASTNEQRSNGFWFYLTGERGARGWMNDSWSTSYSGAMCAPGLHANNDETPLTTLPRSVHSEGAV